MLQAPPFKGVPGTSIRAKTPGLGAPLGGAGKCRWSRDPIADCRRRWMDGLWVTLCHRVPEVQLSSMYSIYHHQLVNA